MTPERLSLLRALVDEALELPVDRRRQMLQAAQSEDPELGDMASELLFEQGELGDFLELPALTDDDPQDCLLGQRIGPYRIEGELAKGGMGAVYAAVRDDGEFDQRVAIKLIRQGLHSRALLRRFHQERQLLASLDHPNIAKLLDGGATEDGRPYIVMELIEGIPIDQYCDEHQLSIRHRIEIFRQACSAVQYAHQNLVVHRDIKPQNLLVTNSGDLKLVDFGISKMLEGQATATRFSEQTMTAMRPMTPAYASPEQIRGDRVTTSSDVYSLGVVLYELLCGRRPFKLDELVGYEQERAVCETQPERPSTRLGQTETVLTADGDERVVTPSELSRRRGERLEQLRRTLRGDLDNIVLRAMGKHAATRYASAQQFDDDLSRYLNGLPVTARADTLTYRASKFVRRNRTGVLAAAVILITLVGGIVVSTGALIKEQRAERLAQEERASALASEVRAKRVAEFLQELLATANPYRTGEDRSVVDLLDDAEERLVEEASGQPETLADIRVAIARTYAGLWRWEDATRNLREAVEIIRPRIAPENPEFSATLTLYGRALTHTGDEQAIPIQEEALRLRRTQYGPENLRVAETLCAYGYALWILGGPERRGEAERAYRDSLEMFARLHDGPTSEHARSAYSFAAFLHENSNPTEASEWYELAISIYRALPFPEDRYMAECLFGYSFLLHERGDSEGAEDHLREYFRLTPDSLNDNRISLAQWRLGWVRHLQDDVDDAREQYHRALLRDLKIVATSGDGPLTEHASDLIERFRIALQTDTPAPYVEILHTITLQPKLVRSRAQYFYALGDLLHSTHVDDEEVAYYLDLCIKRIQLHLNRNHRILRPLRALLGDSLRRLGEFEEAEGLLMQAYHGARARFGESHWVTQEDLKRILKLYEEWEKPEKIEEFKRYLHEADRLETGQQARLRWRQRVASNTAQILDG